jgi:hypothetical protein
MLQDFWKVYGEGEQINLNVVWEGDVEDKVCGVKRGGQFQKKGWPVAKGGGVKDPLRVKR